MSWLVVSCGQVCVEEVLAVVEEKGEDADVAMEQLERLLFILHTLVAHRGGAKVTKPELVCQVRGHFRPMRFDSS